MVPKFGISGKMVLKGRLAIPGQNRSRYVWLGSGGSGRTPARSSQR